MDTSGQSTNVSSQFHRFAGDLTPGLQNCNVASLAFSLHRRVAFIIYTEAFHCLRESNVDLRISFVDFMRY